MALAPSTRRLPSARVMGQLRPFFLVPAAQSLREQPAPVLQKQRRHSHGVSTAAHHEVNCRTVMGRMPFGLPQPQHAARGSSTESCTPEAQTHRGRPCELAGWRASEQVRQEPTPLSSVCLVLCTKSACFTGHNTAEVEHIEACLHLRVRRVLVPDLPANIHTNRARSFA